MKTLILTLLALTVTVSTAYAQNGGSNGGNGGNRPPVSKGLAFNILVDLNQLEPTEAAEIASFRTNGLHLAVGNSPAGTFTSQVVDNGNGQLWAVSEDGRYPSQPFTTAGVDAVSKLLGHVPNRVFAYVETTDTVLSPSDIAAFANHYVPGYGLVGPRILVLDRGYIGAFVSYLSVLSNPDVAGVVFEINPSYDNAWNLDIATGIRNVINSGHECYLLLPPVPDDDPSAYLPDVQGLVEYLSQYEVLNNPKLYLVPAVYSRVSTGVSFMGNNSIQTAVSWLLQYKANQ